MKDWKEYNDAENYLKEAYAKAYEMDEAKRTSKVVGVALIFVFLVAIFAAVMVIIFYPAPAQAAELVDMRIIQHIESRGNARAISPAGAVGLYQIMPVALKDYNQFHKVKYNRRDLYNPEINTKIARWLLTVRIPQLLAYYHRPVTTKTCIIAYNAGIRAVVRGYTPRETRQYIIKYNRLREASRG